MLSKKDCIKMNKIQNDSKYEAERLWVGLRGLWVPQAFS